MGGGWQNPPYLLYIGTFILFEPPKRQERQGEGEKNLAFFAPSHPLRLRILCAFASFAPSHPLCLRILCAFASFAPLHPLRPCVRLVPPGATNTQAEDDPVFGRETIMLSRRRGIRARLKDSPRHLHGRRPPVESSLRDASPSRSINGFGARCEMRYNDFNASLSHSFHIPPFYHTIAPGPCRNLVSYPTFGRRGG
jgi:hypothetical protein